jgi:tetratricopeptide (TPR) repeat protein
MADSDNGINFADFLIASIAKEYAWKSNPAKPSTFSILSLIAEARGTNVALEKFAELKKSGADQNEIDEFTLNGLGYQLLRAGHVDDAILIFKRNVAEYPNSWNPYDSLGEAYMHAGQKDLAIQNYEKSIALNPKNQNGIDFLKKLKQ